MSACCSGWFSFSLSSVGILLLVLLLIDWLNRKNKGSGKLNGQHVVITGGSSGIGKEVAILAAKRGGNVTILARNVKKLEEASNEIRASAQDDQKVNYFSVNVTNYEETDNVLQRCAEEVGPIDILICCAGYAYPSKLEDIPLEHVRGMMDINYMGTLHAVRSVLPSMKSRRRGKIAITSSLGGLVGLFGYTAYAASKFALRGFAEALNMEVKPFNISVTLAFPPDTDTAGFQEENKYKPVETKLLSEAAGLAKPDDVAETMLNDILAGDFFSCSGFDGNLTSVMCAGMSPMSSGFGLVAQVLFMGPLRLVGLGYLAYFNRIVNNCSIQKEKFKKAE